MVRYQALLLIWLYVVHVVFECAAELGLVVYFRSVGHWVADEMRLKVGGEKYWNWNVMDESTRYMLASHLTKERNAAAARAVM